MSQHQLPVQQLEIYEGTSLRAEAALLLAYDCQLCNCA